MLDAAVATVTDPAALREHDLLEEQIEATFAMLGLMVEAAAFQPEAASPVTTPRGPQSLSLLQKTLLVLVLDATTGQNGLAHALQTCRSRSGGRSGLGLVDVGFLSHASGFELRLGVAVHLFVPQQGAALALLGFEFRLLGLELLDELGGVGLVIGAAEEGHAESLGWV